MLESRVSCVGCHRIGESGGRIGPSLNGIGLRDDVDSVLEAIRTNQTLMPVQSIPPRDAERLAQYLVSLAPDPPGAPPAPGRPLPEPIGEEEVDGEALYARHCAACHGPTGGGDGWNSGSLPVRPTVHSDAVAMRERADDTLFDAIYSGGYVLDKSNRMPAYGALLSTEQMRALVRHIRTLCSCEQPAWARGGHR